MPDPVVVNIPLVGDVEFPSSMSSLEIQQASAKLHNDAAQKILLDPNRKPASAEQFAPPSKSPLNALLGLLPAVGATVGGVVAGPPGAAGGGAAGKGYQDLVEHASEIPGAVSDISGNLLTHLLSLAQGANSGMNRGALEMGTTAAEQGALEGAGAAAGKYIVQPIARGVMRGYLKPSLAGSNINDARQIVQTALDEALPVTKGGEARAGRLIGDLNSTINDALSQVKGKIDLGDVADKVREFAKAKYFKPGVSDADYQAALDVADAIDNHAALSLPNGGKVTAVNATSANEIKQAVRPPSRAYGQQGYGPEVTTRKVAGSQMRQAIEDAATASGQPNVGTMNAREGHLIDAQDAIQRAAGREENKGLNPTAIPNLIAGGVGLEEGYRKDPAAGLAWTLATRAALSPAIATRAAIAAYKLARNGYSVSAAARAAVALAQSQAAQEGDGNPNGAK